MLLQFVWWYLWAYQSILLILFLFLSRQQPRYIWHWSRHRCHNPSHPSPQCGQHDHLQSDHHSNRPSCSKLYHSYQCAHSHQTISGSCPNVHPVKICGQYHRECGCWYCYCRGRCDWWGNEHLVCTYRGMLCPVVGTFHVSFEGRLIATTWASSWKKLDLMKGFTHGIVKCIKDDKSECNKQSLFVLRNKIYFLKVFHILNNNKKKKKKKMKRKQERRNQFWFPLSCFLKSSWTLFIGIQM